MKSGKPPRLRHLVDRFRTPSMDLQAILERIDRRQRILKPAGRPVGALSDRATSLAAGMSPQYLTSLRRQFRMGTQHGLTTPVLERLARALQANPEWLLFGTGPEEASSASAEAKAAGQADSQPAPPALAVSGAIAPGHWLEPDSQPAALPQILVPADPRYPAAYQYALEVRGSAIDRIARPGDFLIVFDRPVPATDPRPGDLTIVTRTRNGLREMTARRFHISGFGFELSYDSTDPRYASEPPLRFAANEHRIGDTVIAFDGVVLAVYRPLTTTSY